MKTCAVFYVQQQRKNGKGRKHSMKRKLIFFDIDGTLSKVGENVSERTIAAIKAAQKNGHLCYVCTGRNYPVIDQQILEIGFDGVVASAGGYVKMGNQVLFNQGFIPEVLQNLIEDMRKLPLLLIRAEKARSGK
jgi:hypothetical protein